jgi:hypothetical protein
LYAVILRGNRFNEETIARSVAELGRECRPALPQRDINAAVHQSRQRRKFLDASIAARLLVTPEEAVIVPRWGAQVVPNPVEPIKLTPTERRDLMLRLVEDDGGSKPPCRQMVIRLANYGVRVSHMTVANDYRTMFAQNHPLFTHVGVSLFSHTTRVKRFQVLEAGA